MDERRLRDILQRIAGEIPPPVGVPSKLTRRAKRRIAVNASLAVGLAAVLVLGSFAGIRALRDVETPQPVGPTETRDDFVVFNVSLAGRAQRLDVLELNPKIGAACFEVGVRGATSVHVHVEGESGTQEPVLTLLESNQNPYVAWGCTWNFDPAVVRAIVDSPEDYYLDFHNERSGESLTRNLEKAPPGASQRVTTIGLIAFLRGRGEQHIYTMRSDGTGVQRVTTDPYSGSHLSWSPDGSKIVFGRGLSEGHGEIGVINWDGTDESVILSDEGSEAPLNPQGPAWSPDGSRIAFYSGEGDIYVMNVDGTGLRKLTDSGDECGDLYPTWSPDATKIAYTHDCGRGQIFIMEADGSGQTALTDGPSDLQPAWSPDGTKIAFSRGVEHIYMVTVETGEEARLTEQPDNYEPEWSPDGTAIVFGTNRDGNQEIYVMRSDGRDETRLTNSPLIDIAPSWGPR